MCLNRHSASMDQYELLFWQALHKVRDEQYFLKSDLTIETLADVLNTNRSYLSVSINRFCDKGFSVWLNNFRIQHAEQLMRENLQLPLKICRNSVAMQPLVLLFETLRGVIT